MYFIALGSKYRLEIDHGQQHLCHLTRALYSLYVICISLIQGWNVLYKLYLVLPDCSESPLVSSDARQNRQMMGIKGQIPALCGEFWIFPVEPVLLAEFFNPFCCLSCCHIQTGIFADVNPWLWIMQVIWINLVYNNLEKRKAILASITISVAIWGRFFEWFWQY